MKYKFRTQEEAKDRFEELVKKYYDNNKRAHKLSDTHFEVMHIDEETGDYFFVLYYLDIDSIGIKVNGIGVSSIETLDKFRDKIRELFDEVTQ